MSILAFSFKNWNVKICCGCGQLTHVQLYGSVVNGQTLLFLSLSAQEWDKESEKGSGLQLPAATVTTASVDAAGVRAEGMQQEPPPEEK